MYWLSWHPKGSHLPEINDQLPSENASASELGRTSSDQASPQVRDNDDPTPPGDHSPPPNQTPLPQRRRNTRRLYKDSIKSNHQLLPKEGSQAGVGFNVYRRPCTKVRGMPWNRIPETWSQNPYSCVFQNNEITVKLTDVRCALKLQGKTVHGYD